MIWWLQELKELDMHEYERVLEEHKTFVDQLEEQEDITALKRAYEIEFGEEFVIPWPCTLQEKEIRSLIKDCIKRKKPYESEYEKGCVY